MAGRIFPNLTMSQAPKALHGINLNDPLFSHLRRQGVGSQELGAGHNTTTRSNPMRDRVGKPGAVKASSTDQPRARTIGSGKVSNRPQSAKEQGRTVGRVTQPRGQKVNPRKHTADTDADAPGTKGRIKTTGTYKGKSNKLGHGGRAQQLKDRGVPGGVIGNLARRAQAAPGQKNYHGGK